MKVDIVDFSKISYTSKHRYRNKRNNVECLTHSEIKNETKQNDVFDKKMEEIWSQDPSFNPNLRVADRLIQLKQQKLSKFDNDEIKVALSTEAKNTDRMIKSINVIEKFSPDEIKLLMSSPYAKRNLSYLMQGYAPVCSLDDIEIQLRKLLFDLQNGVENI